MFPSFLRLAEITLPASNKNHFSIIPAVNNAAAVRPCAPYKPTRTAYRLFSSGIVPNKRRLNTFFFLIQCVLDRFIFRDHLVMILTIQYIFSHVFFLHFFDFYKNAARGNRTHGTPNGLIFDEYKFFIGFQFCNPVSKCDKHETGLSVILDKAFKMLLVCCGDFIFSHIVSLSRLSSSAQRGGSLRTPWRAFRLLTHIVIFYKTNMVFSAKRFINLFCVWIWSINVYCLSVIQEITIYDRTI